MPDPNFTVESVPQGGQVRKEMSQQKGNFSTGTSKMPSSTTLLKWLGVLAVVLFIGSVFVFWFGGISFSEGQVQLTVDGPTQVAVGDEVVYKATYKNTNNTTLYRIHLSFTYPDGSVVIKDGQIVKLLSNVEGRDLEELKPGDTHEEEFHAFLVGDKGNIKTAKAKLTFDAGNLKSKFEKTADISTTITDVPVSLTLSAPPNTTTGQVVTYTLDYRNQSDGPIPDLRLVFEYPEGFTPAQFSPQPSQTKNTWNLPVLQKNQGSRIRITGPMSGNEGDSKRVNVTLQRAISGEFIDYMKTSTTTVISSPLLSVSIRVNDSADYVAHPGDTLEYQINYRNNSGHTLSGLVLTARLNGSMYDFGSIDPRNGFFDSGTRTIMWDSRAISDLESLRPNQTGSATFTARLRSGSGSGGAGSSFVQTSVELMTPNVPSGVEAQVISTQNELITKITNEPAFGQSVYYSDPVFGSSGPMPPQPGKETTFTVHWLITNPGNDLGSAKVIATLPPGVTWKNVMSVGAGQPEPTFNKNTSQITWNLNTLPAGAGLFGSKYEAVFQVIVKPSSTQSGSAAQILKSPTLSGSDNFTGQQIVVNAPDVSTNDTVDRGGQGIVQ